ncbi:alpha-amylase family protein [Austwickia chelonae]|uniref:alpha-amylase family protein n=1 Tax=Austwickia chelonae TaxID=100225 RepID=UPI000E21CF0A|nr:alpha-amylase family protein [Austwickia chelonae]
MTSSWADHAIWWQVYPLGFCDAPIRPTEKEQERRSRLDRIIPWLDYLIELGANGLSLGPIFASRSHGYDTVDHFAIDPRLGDHADFDRLAAACHERGIALMLDGVFNHVGTDHPLFQDALANPGPNPYFDIEHGPDGPRYADFEGHHSLARLKHDEDAVAALVIDVMNHWSDRGVTGWRLDAAYAVPLHFWTRVLPAVRAEHPDLWVMGEVIHGDYTQIVAASGMDSVTQYELWKAVWSSLHDDNLYELDWCLARHGELLDSFVPHTFIGNHDVTRIATRVGEAKAALATVILFTVGGIPAVYYGDEQAFRGEKTERIGGDDEIRPSYPQDPAELSTLGEWMLRLHQDLIGLRRRHPWLTTAKTRSLHLENRSYSYASIGAQGQRLRVDLTLEDRPHATITVDGEPPLQIMR